MEEEKSFDFRKGGLGLINCLLHCMYIYHTRWVWKSIGGGIFTCTNPIVERFAGVAKVYVTLDTNFFLG